MDTDDLELVPAQDPGDDFEIMFWGLLCRRYRPADLVYFPAEMGGDYGLEGYSTDGTAYQCYADRDSTSLRHRTDKQKKKLYADTAKLRSNAEKIEPLLNDMVIEHYFLLVPQYHAVELVQYAADRSSAVREYGLPFISDSFTIRIKTPKDYPAELRAALQDAAAKAMITTSPVEDEELSLFGTEKPELVQVLEEKLRTLGTRDLDALRNRFVRAFLAKEQIRASLRNWPGTWEAVEERRRLRQELLEFESDLSPEPGHKRVLDLMKNYEDDLTTNVAGLRQPDAQKLALGQVGEWLMRCPLRFEASA